MAATDFITALGRVLHDGAARDAFAADPVAFVRQIGLCENDHPAFLRLAPADLEFQARVLLRKRFVLVQERLPRTCERMGGEAWPEFMRYGRANTPQGGHPSSADALGFSRHLASTRAETLCPLEVNRCRLLMGAGKWAVHVAPSSPSTPFPVIQVLKRKAPNRWKEWLLYVAI